MNVNSAKGKPAEIANILDYTKPDVVVMSKTKLDKSCYTSEFYPRITQLSAGTEPSMVVVFW